MSSIERLPGSRIKCRETDEELVLYLQRRSRGALMRVVAVVVPLLLVIAIFLVQLNRDLPFVVTLVVATLAGTCMSLVFFFWFAFIVGRQLSKTFVHITLEQLILKTVVYGREKVQKYNLSEKSYAKQDWVQIRRGGSYPQGIDVTSRGGTAHFGDALSRGELDWVEWRINRFLGQATVADAPAGAMASQGVVVAPIEGLPDKPVAPPKGTKIRTEEDAFESRIYFPGTAEMGSYKGIGSAVFGLGWSGYFLFGMLQAWGRRHATGVLIGCGMMALFGLLFLLTGVARLFGRSRLTISAEKITFQTTVLGIGPWATMATADVISVGSTKKPRGRSGRLTGPAKGHVIRTATSEIHYGDQLRDAVRNKAEADWLASEIALRIYAFRSGGLPPVRHRRREPDAKPVDVAPKPSPQAPIPYDIHKRPMPTGGELETLLPVRVGPFCRSSMDEHDEVRNTIIEAEYSSGDGGLFGFGGGISVSLGIYDDPDGSQEAIAVAQAEVSAFDDRPDDQLSLNTEPSFFRTTTGRGAFMAWTRRSYYFSAWIDAKNGEEMLDRFMEAFPY